MGLITSGWVGQQWIPAGRSGVGSNSWILMAKSCEVQSIRIPAPSPIFFSETNPFYFESFLLPD